MWTPLRHAGNERGATLVLIALSMVAMLGFLALAVDVGMLYSSRAEAQRAADAAALAGASALVDYTLTGSRTAAAESRGSSFATRNHIRHSAIQSDEVTVELVGTDRIRATVQRDTVRTFFAPVLNPNWARLPVGATAVARAVSSGTVNCLKPFALPYEDKFFATHERQLIWNKQADSLRLIGFDDFPPGTGNLQPYIANPGCNPNATLSVGSEPPLAPDNNRLGQVVNGIKSMYDQDPHLYYNDRDNLFYNEPNFTTVRDNWQNSPRVGKVALYEPQPIGTGTGTVKIKGFVTIFFDAPVRDRGDVYVYGRVFPTTGLSDGCSAAGCATKTYSVRLVQ